MCEYTNITEHLPSQYMDHLHQQVTTRRRLELYRKPYLQTLFYTFYTIAEQRLLLHRALLLTPFLYSAC